MGCLVNMVCSNLVVVSYGGRCFLPFAFFCPTIGGIVIHFRLLFLVEGGVRAILALYRFKEIGVSVRCRGCSIGRSLHLPRRKCGHCKLLSLYRWMLYSLCHTACQICSFLHRFRLRLGRDNCRSTFSVVCLLSTCFSR